MGSTRRPKLEEQGWAGGCIDRDQGSVAMKSGAKIANGHFEV